MAEIFKSPLLQGLGIPSKLFSAPAERAKSLMQNPMQGLIDLKNPTRMGLINSIINRRRSTSMANTSPQPMQYTNPSPPSGQVSQRPAQVRPIPTDNFAFQSLMNQPRVIRYNRMNRVSNPYMAKSSMGMTSAYNTGANNMSRS
jgi:hypothetical protein